MHKSVLIIADTRFGGDKHALLRVYDAARAMHEDGWEVEMIVPRMPITAREIFSKVAHFHVAPSVPFANSLPCGASVRRFFIAFFHFFCAIKLLHKNHYHLIHGIDDGAIVAAAARRFCHANSAFVAEMVAPFHRMFNKFGPLLWLVKRWEAWAVCQAHAVIFSEEEFKVFFRKVPISPLRLSIVLIAYEAMRDVVTQERFEYGQSIRQIYSRAILVSSR